MFYHGVCGIAAYMMTFFFLMDKTIFLIVIIHFIVAIFWLGLFMMINAYCAAL